MPAPSIFGYYLVSGRGNVNFKISALPLRNLACASHFLYTVRVPEQIATIAALFLREFVNFHTKQQGWPKMRCSPMRP